RHRDVQAARIHRNCTAARLLRAWCRQAADRRAGDAARSEMIGTLRSAAAIALILIASLPMALWQIIALKSNGRLDDGRIPRLWHRMAVRLLGIRIHVRGAPSKKRPLLIASNHISWSDIMVLGSLDEVHFIAKAEVATWPIFGTLARLQRSVFVERQARRKSGEQATEIARRMSDGD